MYQAHLDAGDAASQPGEWARQMGTRRQTREDLGSDSSGFGWVILLDYPSLVSLG
jgi:hypothetical protein